MLPEVLFVNAPPLRKCCVKKNVLIVLADQFRADCLGVAGHPDLRTPTLDQLAADGVYYPNSFCVAPLCTPSRYTLLTGHLPAQHGVHRNNHPLARAIPTLPERAGAVGIRCTTVGKMHLTPTYMDAGFDQMVLCEQNGDGRLDDDYHRELIAAGLIDAVDLIDQRAEFRKTANAAYRTSFGAAVSDLPEAWHSTTWTTDRALSLIDESWAGGGQLMYLSYVKPHHPFDPPAPWDARYDAAALSILPGWTDQVPADDLSAGYFDNASLTRGALQNAMALYYGSISHLDFHLGRVLHRLRELDAYRDTLIIFTSDHGEYLGFHHMLLKSGPMYDPVVGVPLIVKPAGTAQPRGTVDDRLTSGADIVPTTLAALELDSSPELTGHDLLDTAWTRSVVVSQSGDSGYMARSRHAKLLRAAGRSRYFDLEADPWELSPAPVQSAADLEAEADQVAALARVGGGGHVRQNRWRGSAAGRSPSTEDRQLRLQQFGELLDRTEHPWLTR